MAEKKRKIDGVRGNTYKQITISKTQMTNKKINGTPKMTIKYHTELEKIQTQKDYESKK